MALFEFKSMSNLRLADQKWLLRSLKIAKITKI